MLFYDQVELLKADDGLDISKIIVRHLEHAKEEIKEIADILAIADPDAKKEEAIKFVRTKHTDGTEKKEDQGAVMITVVVTTEKAMAILKRPGP